MSVKNFINNQDRLFATKNPTLYGQWHYISSFLLFIPLRAHVLLAFTTSVFHKSTREHINISTSSAFNFMIAQDSQLKVHMLLAAFLLMNLHAMRTLSIQILMHLHIKNFPTIEWLNGLNDLWYSWIFSLLNYLVGTFDFPFVI